MSYGLQMGDESPEEPQPVKAEFQFDEAGRFRFRLEYYSLGWHRWVVSKWTPWTGYQFIATMRLRDKGTRLFMAVTEYYEGTQLKGNRVYELTPVKTKLLEGSKAHKKEPNAKA